MRCCETGKSLNRFNCPDIRPILTLSSNCVSCSCAHRKVETTILLGILEFCLSFDCSPISTMGLFEATNTQMCMPLLPSDYKACDHISAKTFLSCSEHLVPVSITCSAVDTFRENVLYEDQQYTCGTTRSQWVKDASSLLSSHWNDKHMVSRRCPFFAFSHFNWPPLLTLAFWL